MRLLFAAIFLLAVPVLVIAHRQHYAVNMQGPFYDQMEKALAGPAFAKVKTSLAYMDATLHGVVPDLASRDEARRLVDNLRGIRCREEDNLIQVTARIDGKLTDKTLTLSGWIHDNDALQGVIRWLTRARPGIHVDTSGVKVNLHVTMEEVPTLASVPAAFRAALSTIEVPASLKIERSGPLHVVSGHLPSEALRKAVIAALPAPASRMGVDSSKCEAGTFVRTAKFADDHALPVFLKAFFSTPGAAQFKADSTKVRAAGLATPSMQGEWTTLLEPVARDTELETYFELFPSVYHFPGRPLESRIPSEALVVLRDVLAATTINFEPGYASSNAAEQPKLAAAASAIIAAGPDARVLVGGHMDEFGNPKDNETMARRRAEHVIAELTGRGVPSRALEVAVFEHVPGSTGRGRQVELLIK
jgi:hypothetical protein